jgi:small neutral amino acid transporter SnatA (MarC family)
VGCSTTIMGVIVTFTCAYAACWVCTLVSGIIERCVEDVGPKDLVETLKNEPI